MECQSLVTAQAWAMQIHPHRSVVTQFQALLEIARFSYSFLSDILYAFQENGSPLQMTGDLSVFDVRSNVLLPLDGLEPDENRENIIVEVIFQHNNF